MKRNNKIMLITYSDSIGANLKELSAVLNRYYSKAIGGVHILPFYPSSADRGFAPMTYREVDPAFGNWEDVEALARDYYLMFDYMINHISRNSEYFQDFLKRKDASPYKDLFIRYKDFWPNGEATQEDIDRIYKRKPRPPYIEAEFADGTQEKIWCTFDEEQIDLNLPSETAKEFNRGNLRFLTDRGAALIRLDALAYATKKAGTDCFFVEPNLWDILEECERTLRPLNVELLPEIHEHYRYQMKLSEHGYWVYDFALPMLVLYSLYSGKKNRLEHWLEICPRKQFTTLDTHDGIGIVDVKDLLSDEEIDFTKEYLFTNGANIKKVYNTAAYNNLDIYQVNCTYYSALGDDDKAYLLARAIQFFAPGIPQVYYVGLFAGRNDIDLLEKTKVGRNINRHYYTLPEIEREVERPVVKSLIRLMEFRNSYPAFEGDLTVVKNGKENQLQLVWYGGTSCAELDADLVTKEFSIHYLDGNGKRTALALS
jgi:sucrose phosphorylase